MSQLAQRHSEPTSSGLMSGVDDLDENFFKLLKWSFVDVVLELKTSISNDGVKLDGLGKNAANHAYQRMRCMLCRPIVVIADKNWIMFFHCSVLIFKRR